MSLSITYNGSTLTTADDGDLVTLSTAGKYVPTNIIITDTTDVSDAFAAVTTKGGTVPANATRADLADAILSIPTGVFSDVVTTLVSGGDYHAISGVDISGSVDITTNGLHDVTNYSQAQVSVSGATITQDTTTKVVTISA